MNGRRRWPLHVRCCRKKFTFAILSPDEFLLTLTSKVNVNVIQGQIWKWLMARPISEEVIAQWGSEVVGGSMRSLSAFL